MECCCVTSNDILRKNFISNKYCKICHKTGHNDDSCTRKSQSIMSLTEPDDLNTVDIISHPATVAESRYIKIEPSLRYIKTSTGKKTSQMMHKSIRIHAFYQSRTRRNCSVRELCDYPYQSVPYPLGVGLVQTKRTTSSSTRRTNSLRHAPRSNY